MSELQESNKKIKRVRKITKLRLKNIALYYLKRFESSAQNLRSVLMRRVNDYARTYPEYDKTEAIDWIEEIIADFEGYGYLNDERYAEIKIKNYLAAGKSLNYVKQKLQEKGIAKNVIGNLLEEAEYNPFEAALKLAKKKRIGPFRVEESTRKENRQKDMAALVRAGFDFDTVQKILTMDIEELEE